MKIQEVKLSGPAQSLEVGGKQIGQIACMRSDVVDDNLRITFVSGATVELSSAADISEKLNTPRLFVIEGRPPDLFAVFGGEKMYWLDPRGVVVRTLALFRRLKYTEYWTTQFVEQREGVIIIYESGIVAIDDNLNLRWQRKKYFNDSFIGLDDNVIKFVEDDERQWSIRTDNGSEIF